MSLWCGKAMMSHWIYIRTYDFRAGLLCRADFISAEKQVLLLAILFIIMTNPRHNIYSIKISSLYIFLLRKGWAEVEWWAYDWKVAGLVPTLPIHVLKCPWVRHGTPHCHWETDWLLRGQLCHHHHVNLCVHGWMGLNTVKRFCP